MATATTSAAPTAAAARIATAVLHGCPTAIVTKVMLHCTICPVTRGLLLKTTVATIVTKIMLAIAHIGASTILHMLVISIVAPVAAAKYPAYTSTLLLLATLLHTAVLHCIAIGAAIIYIPKCIVAIVGGRRQVVRP